MSNAQDFNGEEFYSGYWEDETKESFLELLPIFSGDSSKALEYCIQFAAANLDAIRELRQNDDMER